MNTNTIPFNHADRDTCQKVVLQIRFNKFSDAEISKEYQIN